MAQLTPWPLTVSCFSKIHIGFTFLVLTHPGSPGQRAVKCACVCVCRSVEPLHQQNPQVLNWRCRLTQIDVYNGCGCCCVVVCRSVEPSRSCVGTYASTTCVTSSPRQRGPPGSGSPPPPTTRCWSWPAMSSSARCVSVVSAASRNWCCTWRATPRHTSVLSAAVAWRTRSSSASTVSFTSHSTPPPRRRNRRPLADRSGRKVGSGLAIAQFVPLMSYS